MAALPNRVSHKQNRTPLSSSLIGRKPKVQKKQAKLSMAKILLRYSGTWVGNDLERCLAEVYATRGEAKF